jgi:carboxyl-terminal processing protease
MQETFHNPGFHRRSLFLGVIFGLAVGLAFAAGFLFRGVAAPLIVAADSNNYMLLDEVQSLLDDYFLHEQPSTTQREYGAIRGLLSTLNDQYTFFIDPPVAQSESDVLAGTYGGIGVQVQRSESGEFVLYPFTESPAKRAGIQDGDILIAINDAPIDLSLQQDALEQMLRGEVRNGNGVELGIRKQLTHEIVTLFIPFEVVNVPSVTWRVLAESTQIGYVQVLLFTSRTPDELKAALQELRQMSIQALILDLRNNSGGLLQESIAVASQLIDGGTVVYERTRLGERSLNTNERSVMTDLPLAVLINKGTASAAELVAGAIRDRQRGILIGQTTYGKGTVQQIFRLSDNSSLHITTAEWLTPARQHLDGRGLEPTVAMIPDVNGRDIELGEAIRYLLNILSIQDPAS